ncbi:MAG: 2-hydroxyacid dehydrogenase [Thermoplasmata archaeon]
MHDLLVTVQLDDEDRRTLERAVGPATRLHHLSDVEGQLEDLLPRVEAILCAGLRQFTPAMIQRMESLRMVQTLLAGADYLPREFFRSGVAVCTASGAGSHHIAEHAFALLLAAGKNVVLHTNAIRQARFDRSPVNHPLGGKALGILGFGNIGRIVGEFGRAFGMRILAINRSGRTDLDVGFIGALDDLEHLLRASDYITITLPLTRKTIGLIGPEELAAMKPEAVLVNVARAGVVQEEALYRHLKANPGFRAAFDVWWTYPEGEEGRPFSLPFHELNNFIMTPHIAGHVPGHRKEMMRLAIENIGNFFMKKRLVNRVKEEDIPP